MPVCQRRHTRHVGIRTLSRLRLSPPGLGSSIRQLPGYEHTCHRGCYGRSPDLAVSSCEKAFEILRFFWNALRHMRIPGLYRFGFSCFSGSQVYGFRVWCFLRQIQDFSNAIELKYKRSVLFYCAPLFRMYFYNYMSYMYMSARIYIYICTFVHTALLASVPAYDVPA